MVEIGHIDIATEISRLSSHNAYPHEGHFEFLLHVMGYLKIKHNSRLDIDLNYPTINEDSFISHYWTSFHGDVQ